ncbi:MAG TPA: hypothetical protein VFY01_10325 [Rheinheimera sp.]|nr:hypothetical protein [Rheinheimera sp.]
MKAMQILTLFGCSVLLALALPAAAQQQSETPYLDIQWNSELVRILLSVDTGLCQADANSDTAPVKSKYDNGNEWPRTLRPSVLRAMFYLAYDYYGMGLNHYFILRQDLMPDFDKRFAVQKQFGGPWPDGRVPTEYIAFKTTTDAEAVGGGMQVASKPGDNSTRIHLRHAVIDPFDQQIVADQVANYQLVSLAANGQRKTPMDFELPANMLITSSLTKYAGGRDRMTLNVGGRAVGLLRTEAYTYPDTNKAASERSDIATRPYRVHSRASRPDALNSAWNYSGYAWGAEHNDFGEGLTSIDATFAKHQLCKQWRMQQERERSGQATDIDRLLKALMQRAGFTDESGELWVIPAEGY